MSAIDWNPNWLSGAVVGKRNPAHKGPHRKAKRRSRHATRQGSKRRKRCRHYNRPKRKYASLGEAESARIWMARKCKALFLVFRCPHCGWWHVGRRWEDEIENLARTTPVDVESGYT